MLHVNNFSNTILTNINFDMSQDENLIILGSNGAGKSTLAKVICGLISSTEIKIFNEDLHTLSAKKRSQLINYVPPKLEIFDEYISVAEYLQLSRLYSHVSVDKVIILLGLESLRDKPCKNLSSGEQQLLMLASSILHNAKLTIFDEPTANLDPQKTLKVYGVLKSDEVQNRIIITHDLSLAYKLGYKIIYMSNGEIEFFDDSRKFFEKSNLDKFFGSSLKRVDDCFVVNL